MQLLGSGLAVVALAWGLGKVKVFQQVFGGGDDRKGLLYFQWTRWVVPIVLLIVLIGYIYSDYIL